MTNSGSDETKDFAHEPSDDGRTHLRTTVLANGLADSQDFQTDQAYPDVPNCRIVGVLGKGGMGIVYAAEQPELHRTVAVKTILSAIADSPMIVARFFAEAEAMAAVRHPNVAQVYEFGKSHKLPYLVVELLPGGTLADRLADRKPVPPADAVPLVEKIARAVGAAHAAGIVHRDLKPGNVMFDAEGEPKVTDFGLAKRADSNLTVTDLHMGTPYYMAPEQAMQAKFVGPAADVWAVGVILFECLTGKRPFEGPTAPSVIHEVLHADAPPLRRVDAKLPRDLETIVGKCLAKEPHLRYATGTEVADDLARWQAGEPILARRTPPAERLLLWAGRKPMHALAWVLVPLTLLLAAGVVAGLLLWQSAERAYRGEQRANVTVTESNAALTRANATVTQANAALTRAKEQLALFARVRERTLKPTPGWSWDTRTDLAAFGKLTPDAATVADLRTDAVAARVLPDFRETDPLTTGYPVGSLAVSPDGRHVAVGEFKPKLFVFPMGVHLFDAKTGQKVRTVTFKPGLVVNWQRLAVSQDILMHLAFSSDGNHLFAGTKTGRVHWWDLTDKKAEPTKTWEVGRVIASLAVSADGRAAYTFAKTGGVQRWDTGGGKPAAFAADTGTGAVAVRPQTGEVFAGRGSDLFALDPATLAATGPAVGYGRFGLHQLAFHPAGQWLAVGAGRTLRIVDAATRRPTATFLDPVLKTAAHRGSIDHVAVHPSGAVVASLSDAADDHTLKVWNVASGKLVGATAIPGEGLMSLAFSADGRTLFVGTSDRTHRFELRGLDLLRREIPTGGFVEAAAFLPDGAGVAALSTRPADEADPQKTYVLSVAKGGATTDYVFARPRVGSGRFGLATAGDRVAVTTDGSDLLLWAARTPTKHRTVAIPSPSLPRFTPDGKRVWVVDDDLVHKPWAAADGKPGAGWSNAVNKVLKGAAGIQAAAVGRTRVLAGTRDGSVVVVAAATGEVLSRSPVKLGAVTSLALTRDESLAVAGLYTGKVRTLDPTAGTEDEAFTPHRDTVTAVAVCGPPAARYLATGSSDRSLRLFARDGAGWRPLFALNDVEAPVTGLEFSPDGGRLLFSCGGSLGYRVLDLDALNAELAKDGFGWK